MFKKLVACLLVFGLLSWAHSARAAITFSFDSGGIVFPTDPISCPDPFSGCSLTAMGTATAAGGNVNPLPGPWDFWAEFAIVLPPLPDGTFRTTGLFAFDDMSPANNDFSGSLDGILNPATFVNTMTYAVTSSSGVFGGGRGFGSSVIQIFPQGENQPFGFRESGSFTIPEPATVALLGFGLAASAAFRRRRR